MDWRSTQKTALCTQTPPQVCPTLGQKQQLNCRLFLPENQPFQTEVTLHYSDLADTFTVDYT